MSKNNLVFMFLIGIIGCVAVGFFAGGANGRREVANLKRDYAAAIRAADAASNTAISGYRLALDGIGERSGSMATRLRLLADTSTIGAGTLSERMRKIIERFKGIEEIVGGIREINESANRALADGNPQPEPGIEP